jgi:AcrR family transcriptional regulator
MKEAKLTKIDLKRRGEIGRQRRAKSRAQIIEAARFLFTSRSIASVTIEDVTRWARAAKSTFYSNFRSLNDLRSVVAAELAAAFEDFADSDGLTCRTSFSEFCAPSASGRKTLNVLSGA